MKKSSVARAFPFTASALFTTAVLLAGCGVSTNGKGSFSLGPPPPDSGNLPTGSVAGAFRTQVVRDVKDFHAIDTSAVCNLTITVGQPFNVTMEGDEKTIAATKTTVKDGILTIELDRNISSPSPLHMTINMPKLDKLNLSGVNEVNISGLSEDFFTIKASGAGSVTASGNAGMLDLTLSGVGKANLQDLKAKAVTALLSGTGSARVYASESLTATLSGIGSLKYAGNPPKLQKTVSGLGAISAE